MNDLCAYSVRLEMFKKIENFQKNLGFSVPHNTVLTIPKECFANKQKFSNWLGKQNIVHLEELFLSGLVFLHPCPHDESLYRNLSFAGCYNSYKPLKWKSFSENFIDGMFYVYNSRANKYIDTYYSIHAINSLRTFDILLTKAIPNVHIFGTAYVFKNVVFAHYYDSYLSFYNADPHIFVANSAEQKKGIECHIVSIMHELENVLHVGLDVEFIVDTHGKLYINEIRPLSARHRYNWSFCDFENITTKRLHRSVINSVFCITGTITDLRQRMPTGRDLGKNIFMIKFYSKEFGPLQFLEWCIDNELKGVTLLVDHEFNRSCSHMEYLMFEYPIIENIAQSFKFEDSFGESSYKISCDGFDVAFTCQS